VSDSGIIFLLATCGHLRTPAQAGSVLSRVEGATVLLFTLYQYCCQEGWHCSRASTISAPWIWADMYHMGLPRDPATVGRASSLSWRGAGIPIIASWWMCCPAVGGTSAVPRHSLP